MQIQSHLLPTSTSPRLLAIHPLRPLHQSVTKLAKVFRIRTDQSVCKLHLRLGLQGDTSDGR